MDSIVVFQRLLFAVLMAVIRVEAQDHASVVSLPNASEIAKAEIESVNGLATIFLNGSLAAEGSVHVAPRASPDGVSSVVDLERSALRGNSSMVPEIVRPAINIFSRANLTLGSHCCMWPFDCHSCSQGDANICKNTVMCKACDCDCCNPPRFTSSQELKPLLMCEAGSHCTYHKSVETGAKSSTSDWNFQGKASAYAEDTINKASMSATLKAKFHSAAHESFQTSKTDVNVDCATDRACFVYQCVIHVRSSSGHRADFFGPIVQSSRPLHVFAR